MDASHAGSRTKIILAFAFIYIVWGSTYLGIRLCVEEMPPLIFAGSRNLVAGLLTLGGAFMWEAPRPTMRQTLDAAVMGLFLFLGGNGGVAWAEQTIPSGVASLLLGTTPFWMVTMNRVLHQGAPLKKMAWIGLAFGFLGVAILANPFAGSDLGRLDPLGCWVVFLSSVSWSVGSVWGSRRDLPASPFVSAGIQMASGGAGLLFLSTVSGELPKFHWSHITATGLGSFVYLIFFGSIAGFAAFYYILRRTPTHVMSSYAYVNPVVAVFLGYVFLKEPLGLKTIVSTVCIVGGVAMMLWSAKTRPNEMEHS
jgi:drug/metabolite transporter (DMT)-like permease